MSKYRLLLVFSLIVAFLIASNAYAVSDQTDKVIARAPYTGIQLYGGGIFKTEAQTIAFVEKCKEHGVTVVLPGISAGASALWQTDSEQYAADQADTLRGGYDALEGLVRHAHKAGIKVYPSVAVYFAGKLLSDHPEWETRDREGRPSRDTYGTATLAFSYPQARQVKINMLMDLVKGYDIDGILLDRLRYPENTKQPEWNHGYYGYDPLLLDACQSIYGFDPRDVPVDSPEWQIFARLRAETLSAFLQEFQKAVRGAGSDIRIGIFAAPDPERRWVQSGRDYGSWGRRGLIDDMYLGMYTQTEAEVRKAIPPVRNALGHVVMLYSSLSPYNNRQKNEQELLSMAETQLDCEVDGLWIYRTDYVDKLGLWDGVLSVSGLVKRGVD
jgi:uncharacterized lipoprotein YddW (UPF0748 family)